LALGLACGDSNTGPAPATYLLFTGQPADDTVGSVVAGVQVTAYTASGIVAAGFNGAVTIAFSANPGNAVLSGTLTRNAVFGIASFTDLAVSKGENGYALTATAAGLATATSSTFDVSEVAPRITLRYGYGLDLETGAIQDCSSACAAAIDFELGFDASTNIRARLIHHAAQAVAHLAGQSFAFVHLADTAGVAFSTTPVTDPFDNARTILVRTDAGNIYKVGNPVELGLTAQDSVRFNVARLN
jgi:hypothetical protein